MRASLSKLLLGGHGHGRGGSRKHLLPRELPSHQSRLAQDIRVLLRHHSTHSPTWKATLQVICGLGLYAHPPPSQTLLDSMQTKEAVGIWKFESQKRNVGSSRFLLERVFLLEENI